MATIDLTQLVDPDAMYRNLTGYENGLAARQQLGIDAIDLLDEPVQILTSREPDPKTKTKAVRNITCITPQFVDGLLRDSIEKMVTLDAFFARFSIVGETDVLRKIRQHVSYSWLRTTHGLPTWLESQDNALATYRRAYPIAQHPWMAAYERWHHAWVNSHMEAADA